MDSLSLDSYSMTMTIKQSSDHQLNCLIVDDNVAAIDSLTYYLGQCDETVLVKSFVDPLFALSFLSESSCQIDLLFLDVDMPSLNGMDFLSIIENGLKYGNPAVVLTTAHASYALPALENSKYTRGFLCKPFGYQRFLSMLEKVKSSTKLDTVLKRSSPKADDKDYLLVKDHGQRETRHIKIVKSDITHIKGGANYPTVYTLDSAFLVRITLIDLSEKLKEYMVRVHKSYLVNLSLIDSIYTHTLYLVNGVEIPLSISHRASLMNALSKANETLS
ncbi:MAG: LytTR family DNA-binding domain-containing protein [Cyclobacteriaceae bacterium]